MPQREGLLRFRNAPHHHKVAPIELFFDLVFIFAVTQLSNYLADHFTLLGATQTLLMLIAVWWAWIYTTWVTNWLNPDTLPVRILLLVLMLPGLIGSSAIPKAFDTRGFAVALAYLGIQISRTVFFVWAAAPYPKVARNFQRVLVWLLAGGVLWIAGAMTDGWGRMWLWGAALTLEFVSPWVGFWVPRLGRSLTTDWEIDGVYMAERCGLFIIIALGESVLMTGLTFSELPWTFGNILTLIVALVGSIAMWWLYFDTAAEIGLLAISQSDDPGKLARFAYTYVHILLISGIIVSAVADAFVLRNPFGRADIATAIAVLSSTGLYLLGIVVFLWAATSRIPQGALVGLTSTAVLGSMAVYLPPVVIMAAAAAVMLATAVHEVTVGRRGRVAPAI
jgi:low temperature requirement protein LtrA